MIIIILLCFWKELVLVAADQWYGHTQTWNSVWRTEAMAQVWTQASYLPSYWCLLIF